MPIFTLSGPDTDIGIMGPSSNPIFNTGTLRLAPQGDARKITCDLTIDLANGEPPFIFEPPIESLVTFTASDEADKVVAGPFSMRGPNKQTELTGGQRLFECHRYGLGGYLFPSSLTPPGTPKTFKFKWAIDPKVGTGELTVIVGVEGEDIWIKEVIKWLP